MANSTGKQDLIVNIHREHAVRGGELQERGDPDELRRQGFGAGAVRGVLRGAVRQDDGGESGLGGDRVRVAEPAVLDVRSVPAGDPDDGRRGDARRDIVGGQIAQGNYVLTRLHARYGKADMKDDLRFREAKPITGPRAVEQAGAGVRRVARGAETNFQRGYAIRHWWTGPMTCKNPQRGVWGGPPDGGQRNTIAAEQARVRAARQARARTVIKRDLWEIGYKKSSSARPVGAGARARRDEVRDAARQQGDGLWLRRRRGRRLLLLGLGLLVTRRKK